MHTHLLMTAAALMIGGLALLGRRQVARLVRDFFGAAASPFNLAVFRIVLFAVILGKIDLHSLVWFSRLPAALEFPPNHLAHILPYIPVSAALVTAAGYLLLAFCLMALVGLWTPVSCAMTVLLGIYVFGVPNLFGKVNHDHHVLWFAAILAASPCSDVLSLDSIWLAWQRADRGVTAPPEAARAYALPLRFVWILMGLAYFFPGFWKLWHSGTAWALSGNIKYFMYERWTGIDGSLPMFRIDQVPLLLKLAGTGTLLFETTFLGLIFFPRIRPLLVLCGLAFHNMTNLYLGISFWTLQWMYVSFVSWDRVFLWLGRRLFPRDLRVIFDGDCRSCRRTVAALRAFDVLGRVEWIDGTEHLPLLLQISRHPLSKKLDQPLPAQPAPRPRQPTRALVLVSAFLILAVFTAGVRQDEYAWPIACYPTFDYLAGPQKKALSVTFTDAAGQAIAVPPPDLSTITTERYEGLAQSLLSIRDPKRQQSALRAYWQVCRQNEPTLAHVTDVRFYQDIIAVTPGQTAFNPVRRKLLYEYKESPAQPLAAAMR